MIQPLDLTKLSPAPWHAEQQHDQAEVWGGEGGFSQLMYGALERMTDLEFVVLARNAFDIQMRRRKEGWCVGTDMDGRFRLMGFMLLESMQQNEPWMKWIRTHSFDNPLTCWIEAEKWYVENVENAPH